MQGSLAVHRIGLVDGGVKDFSYLRYAENFFFRLAVLQCSDPFLLVSFGKGGKLGLFLVNG